MSIYLDDELPKNQEEDDLLEKPKMMYPTLSHSPQRKKTAVSFSRRWDVW